LAGVTGMGVGVIDGSRCGAVNVGGLVEVAPASTITGGGSGAGGTDVGAGRTDVRGAGATDVGGAGATVSGGTRSGPPAWGFGAGGPAWCGCGPPRVTQPITAHSPA
jgi:hypothetical protein